MVIYHKKVNNAANLFKTSPNKWQWYHIAFQFSAVIFFVATVGASLDRLEERKMSDFKGRTHAFGTRTIRPGWQPGYGPKAEDLSE